MYSVESKIRIKCSNYDCNNYFFTDSTFHKAEGYNFCRNCRGESKQVTQVLNLQAKYQKPIKDIIIEAGKLFTSVTRISDYLGVTRAAFYLWLKSYFDMDFESWKKNYICKSHKCLILDINAEKTNWKYWVSQHIKELGNCACFSNIGGHNLLVTNAALSKVSEIFKVCRQYNPIVISDGSGINRLIYPVTTIQNITEDEKES